MSKEKLNALIERARTYREAHPLSPEEERHQIRSFAFGNTHFENPDVTLDHIDSAIETLGGRVGTRP